MLVCSSGLSSENDQQGDPLANRSVCCVCESVAKHTGEKVLVNLFSSMRAWRPTELQDVLARGEEVQSLAQLVITQGAYALFFY